jgi:dipeptide/tripeptide permease
MVVIGSIPGEVNAGFFFPAIYLVALGTGGIKPNVSTMGADQFDDRYSKDRKEKESFFNWSVTVFTLFVVSYRSRVAPYPTFLPSFSFLFC